MSTEIRKRGRPRKFPIKEKPKQEPSFPDLNINEPLNLVHLKLILSTRTIVEKPTTTLPLPSFKKLVQRNNNVVGNFSRPENHYIHYQGEFFYHPTLLYVY